MKTGGERSGTIVAKLLLDTNILVDALRGYEPAEDYLRSLEKDEVHCSVITGAELWAGVRPDEIEELDLFLSAFRLVPIDESAARNAGRYMQRFGNSHGLRLPDALIAASAHGHRLQLITRNGKHFPMSDIRVVKPY